MPLHGRDYGAGGARFQRRSFVRRFAANGIEHSVLALNRRVHCDAVGGVACDDAHTRHVVSIRVMNERGHFVASGQSLFNDRFTGFAGGSNDENFQGLAPLCESVSRASKSEPPRLF
jgi:hypothetical protein